MPGGAPQDDFDGQPLLERKALRQRIVKALKEPPEVITDEYRELELQTLVTAGFVALGEWSEQHLSGSGRAGTRKVSALEYHQLQRQAFDRIEAHVRRNHIVVPLHRVNTGITALRAGVKTDVDGIVTTELPKVRHPVWRSIVEGLAAGPLGVAGLLAVVLVLSVCYKPWAHDLIHLMGIAANAVSGGDDVAPNDADPCPDGYKMGPVKCETLRVAPVPAPAPMH